MSAYYEDNAESIAKWWEQAAPTHDHELELVNWAEYAAYLHAKHGFFVLPDELRSLQMTQEWLQEVLAAGIPLDDEHIERALRGAGREIIEFCTRLTNELRPPVKKGEGPRRAHEGHWSDVTGILASSFAAFVNGQRA